MNENEYYRILKYANELEYDLACELYYETHHYERCVNDFIKNSEINDKYINSEKKANQLYKFIRELDFAFDLPEHPEKHNGFKDSDRNKLIDYIFKIFGITKKEN